MTTLTSPIAKLYKRCARKHHDQCPGSFETWSVCSCDCHAGVSDERPAPITCQDKAAAVVEAVAIVTPKAAPATKVKASDPRPRMHQKGNGNGGVYCQPARDGIDCAINRTPYKPSPSTIAWYNRNAPAVVLPAGAGFTARLVPNDASPKCLDCRIPLSMDRLGKYGNIEGRCNECNVKNHGYVRPAEWQRHGGPITKGGE